MKFFSFLVLNLVILSACTVILSPRSDVDGFKQSSDGQTNDTDLSSSSVSLPRNSPCISNYDCAEGSICLTGKCRDLQLNDTCRIETFNYQQIDDPILLFSLTDQDNYANIGEGIIKSISFAIDEINHTISGHDGSRLLHINCPEDPQVLSKVIQHINQFGEFLIGPMLSQNYSQVASSLEIPLLSPSATNSRLIQQPGIKMAVSNMGFANEITPLIESLDVDHVLFIHEWGEAYQDDLVDIIFTNLNPDMMAKLVDCPYHLNTFDLNEDFEMILNECANTAILSSSRIAIFNPGSTQQLVDIISNGLKLGVINVNTPIITGEGPFNDLNLCQRLYTDIDNADIPLLNRLNISGVRLKEPLYKESFLTAYAQYLQSQGFELDSMSYIENAYDAVYLAFYGLVALNGKIPNPKVFYQTVNELLMSGEQIFIGPYDLLQASKYLEQGSAIDLVGASGPLNFEYDESSESLYLLVEEDSSELWKVTNFRFDRNNETVYCDFD